MAANNLRVIYQNLADLSTTTITASNTKNTGSTTLTGSITGNALTTSVGTAQIGMYLSGTGIPTNTYIVSGSGTSWTLNQSLSTAVASGSSIIGTLTTTPSANLQKDAKSLVWRSSGTNATLTVAFSTAQKVRGIVLPFTNLTSTATITITTPVNAGSFIIGRRYYITSLGDTNWTSAGYVGTAAVNGNFIASNAGSGTGTAEYSIIVSAIACPYAQTDQWDTNKYLYQGAGNYGYLPSGANNYAYGSGTYARAWFPTVETCTSLAIKIIDTNNTAGYIEVSRLVVGDYWSPTYNTSFGLVSAPKSLSTNSRTESGDLVTNRGIQYNTMSFDLTWLTPSDRAVFTKILKSNGINKPLLISLFPDQTSEDYDKEQTFQIYGKLTQMPDLTHPMYSMYSSKIEIEEI